MKTYYKIADSFLEIDGEEKYLQKELELFRIDENEVDRDNMFIINYIASDIPIMNSHKIVETPYNIIYETGEEYVLSYVGLNFVHGVIISKSGEFARIYYTQDDYESEVDLIFAIRDSYFYFLQSKGKVVVHSASIIYNNKAWLFSAMSGTGKSTHVNMWREAGYEFEDLNGDNAVCYIDKNGIPVASSIPWSGTSRIYCNKCVPLGGVVFINRGDNNGIETINKKEGIINLTARCFSPNWNRQLLAKTLEVTKVIGEKCSFSKLYCKPDIDAARVSKEFIDTM